MSLGCGHNHHLNQESRRRISIVFFLNLFFSVIEIIGGIWTGSVGILADAVHDLGDSIALGIVWVLEGMRVRPKDSNYPFGYGRYPLLGAVVSTAIVVSGSIWIFVESIQRMVSGSPGPHSLGMIGLAVLGVAVNSLAAIKLLKGTSASEKVLYWHLVEDVAGWGMVLVGALLYHFTGLAWIDPLLAALISLFISVQVVRRSKSVFAVFLQRLVKNFPEQEFCNKVQQEFGVSISQVKSWSMDGEDVWLICDIKCSSIPSFSATNALELEAKICKLAHVEFSAEVTGFNFVP